MDGSSGPREPRVKRPERKRFDRAILPAAAAFAACATITVRMQVLQAGLHKLIYLELQPDMVTSIARQAGFETKAKDTTRSIQLDLAAPSRQGPLLLFDAADPANLGWRSEERRVGKE